MRALELRRKLRRVIMGMGFVGEGFVLASLRDAKHLGVGPVVSLRSTHRLMAGMPAALRSELKRECGCVGDQLHIGFRTRRVRRN